MPIPYRLNPLGITVREELPLTFTAVEASTVKLTATGSPTIAGLHYRLGTSGTWLPYAIGTVISLAPGAKVQFWNAADTLATSASSYLRFILAGSLTASGNIQSLLNYAATCLSFCFYNLFLSQKALVTMPDLSATELATGCYQSMFEGCENILTACRIIPATTIKVQSLLSCFRNCKKMTVAPEIPATTYMVSALYAAFFGCMALTSAPKIHATSITSSSLYSTFTGDSNLAYVEVDFTSWGNDSTTNWLSNVAASGTFVKPAALPEEYGPNRIPTGWTVINK